VSLASNASSFVNGHTLSTAASPPVSGHALAVGKPVAMDVVRCGKALVYEAYAAARKLTNQVRPTNTVPTIRSMMIIRSTWS
jgi:hypothetical protein